MPAAPHELEGELAKAVADASTPCYHAKGLSILRACPPELPIHSIAPRKTMRKTLIPAAYSLLSFFFAACFAACSGIDIEQSEIGQFAAGNYRYYKWRTEPLPAGSRSSDPLYTLDPVMRKDVDALLQGKGYVLDPGRAQFTVDYLYVSGMVDGERSELASNITPYPRVTPNRRVDQASVDNAIALGGVKATNNIVLQFNDRASNREVWRATMSEIVDDANAIDTSRLDDNLKTYLVRALEPLPPAAPQ
jgi:hypothetical protein